VKIYAICMVKDEIDILQKTLEAALVWADKIFLIDHSSLDGTWELINERLRHWEKIEVYGQITDDFSDGLRSRAYHKYKHSINVNDWWCRLDSDEFYIDNPRVFLSKVGKNFDVVQCASFQYYFTEKDLLAFRENRSLYLDGHAIETLRYFACNSSEARFVRHNNRNWNESNLWPDGKFPYLVWPKHIRLKHFQYRYPEQIQHRLDLRSAKIEGNQFRHEIRDDWNQRIDSTRRIIRTSSNPRVNQRWEERIVDSSKLFYDDGENDYIVRTDLLDPIRTPVQQVFINLIKSVFGRKF
jgi:hypothetical protein